MTFAKRLTDLLNEARTFTGSFTIDADANGFSVRTNPPAFMPVRFLPFDLSPGPNVQFDTNGIPSVIIWSTGQFNQSPTTIAQWGLGGYARSDFAKAQKACDWLVTHQSANGGFPLTFNHSIPNGYNLTAPWYSAITQGNAISLLVRMWKVTGNEAYKDAAVAGLGLLATPVVQGGLKSSLNGKVWFEETADPAYPNHIFNGSVFALLGIHDLFQFTGEGEGLWLEGEDSLRSNINAHIVWQPHQVAGYPDPWGTYDLQVNGVPSMPNYLSDFYMQLHCELLEEMAARTGHSTYSLTAASLRTSLAAYRGA